MKRTGMIITLSIIIVLIITTLLLTFIPYSFKMNINEPDSIVVYRDGDSERYSSGDTVEDIVALIDGSFEQSLLSALFTGSVGESAEIERSYKTISTSSGIYVAYNYDEEQTLMDGNDVYYYSGNSITYDTLIFYIVESTDGFAEMIVYVESQSTEKYSIYRYNVYADYTDLIEYINDMTITES